MTLENLAAVAPLIATALVTNNGCVSADSLNRSRA